MWYIVVIYASWCHVDTYICVQNIAKYFLHKGQHSFYICDNNMSFLRNRNITVICCNYLINCLYRLVWSLAAMIHTPANFHISSVSSARFFLMWCSRWAERQSWHLKSIGNCWTKDLQISRGNHILQNILCGDAVIVKFQVHHFTIHFGSG